MTKEEYTQMLEAMRKRTVAEPQNAEAWRDLAQAKLMGGDLEGAENDLITSLNLYPQNVNALVLLGNLMTNKNDDAAALRFYEKAVQLDPKSPDALCNYGTMLFKNGDKLKAVTYLRQAIEYRPDHAPAYYMLAQCYAAMEDWHSAYLTARDAFEKCRVSVENAHLTNRIAQGLSRVKAMAEAHGGANPPASGEKHMEQSLRQRQFEETHEGKDDPARDMMMTMYMLGALKLFDEKTPEEIKQIAVEIATVGMNGISPAKSSGYTLKSLPGEDFSGYRLLAYYYVSWAIAFPDKLELLNLPFDNAYAAATSMRERPGDNSTKNQMGGGVIVEFIAPREAA